MTFSFVVLGSSGMFATTERAASGYLLDLSGVPIWMDAGAGTWRNLLAQIDYGSLRGVMISHRDPDHTSDVFMAHHARRYGGPEPLPPIPLWAPQQALDHLLSFVPGLGDSFDLRAVAASDAIQIGDAGVSFFEMAHPPSTLGIRVELEGSVLAYSADTGPGADIGALAGGADLFLCEATLQGADGAWEGHLTAEQAGIAAREAKVGRLILTHLPPGRDPSISLAEARSTAGEVRVEIAHDGQRYEVTE